jgi:predicted glycoside hydrolase/deacetylase ChbG (UPF0249 family)
MAGRLIVTADDLGLTDAVSSGIFEVHRDGVVTAASLMATGSAFERAVAEASAYPTLELGVHLVIDEERPLLAGLRTITRGDGAFLDRWELIRRLALRRVDLTEVERCWEAQIERILAAGVRPAFINSHGHIHGFPTLLPIVVRLARRHGIPAIRRPAGPIRAGPIRDTARAALISTSTRWSFARATDPPWSPDRFLGLAESGRLDRAALTRLCRRLTGVTELMAHPGHTDAETIRRYGHWRYKWEGELRALKDASTLELNLTTFLAESAAG